MRRKKAAGAMNASKMDWQAMGAAVAETPVAFRAAVLADPALVAELG